MKLLRLLCEHRMQTLRLGARKGRSYAVFVGEGVCVSGYGETVEEAVWDAVGRLPGGEA